MNNEKCFDQTCKEEKTLRFFRHHFFRLKDDLLLPGGRQAFNTRWVRKPARLLAGLGEVL